MIMQKIEAALTEARGHDDAVAEFEALQGIVAALGLRSQVTSEGLDWAEFYRWYIRRLYDLDEQLTIEINANPVPHQLQPRDPKRFASARIRAILDSLPETAEALPATAHERPKGEKGG